MGDDFLLADRNTGFADNHRVHGLAPLVTGNTDHGALGDGRVVGNGILDFGGENVLAPTDDHVLEPIADIDKAVVIHVATVAGMHPATAQRLGRCLWIVPVAEHDARPACDNFTYAATRQFLVLGIDDTHLNAADR
ncbi:hypothetical protein D3C80_1752820 [compost metagenome]